MRRSLLVGATACLVLLLNGCAPGDPVRVRRADVEVGNTTIRVGQPAHGTPPGQGGVFCPPGQAKKGRC